MKYFFILGKTPLLSFIEIRELLETSNFKQVSDNVLLTDSLKPFNPNKLQKRLGGTIKIGKILGYYKRKELKTDNFKSKILDLLSLDGSRINFGFSFYGNQFKNFKRLIKNTALFIKKDIKSKNISCRWVTSKKPYLSSVVVRKNNLLDKGLDIVITKYNKKLLIGHTLTCQDFEKYSYFDYSKPERPIKKGIIPLKLAKMMINFGLGNKFDVKKVNLLDPFCGSGTILISAALLGIKNIYGSDKDKKSIIYTQNNFNWLIRNSNISLNKAKFFRSDVRKISQNTNQKFNLIVTEPYLGPLKIKKQDVDQQINKLSELYLKAFKEFKHILSKKGKIVIIFPVFDFDKRHFLPILKDLNKMGWKQEFDFSTLSNYKNHLSKRNTLLYFRLNQEVLREVLIFNYNK